VTTRPGPVRSPFVIPLGDSLEVVALDAEAAASTSRKRPALHTARVGTRRRVGKGSGPTGRCAGMATRRRGRGSRRRAGSGGSGGSVGVVATRWGEGCAAGSDRQVRVCRVAVIGLADDADIRAQPVRGDLCEGGGVLA